MSNWLTDLPWTTIAEILAYVVGAVLLVYLTVLSATDCQMVKSTVLREEEVEALHYYFLPTASLTIEAVAEVSITTGSNTGMVTGVMLTNLALEARVNIEPDTERTIAATYVPFVFANDEVDIVTNDVGLLQNVASTSDDRVTAIVAEITDLPKALFDRVEAMTDLEAEPLIFQKETFKTTFIITADEMEKGSFKRQWTLCADGVASGQANQLQLVLETAFATGIKNPLKSNTYNGLLTRPLVKRIIPVTVSQAGGPKLLAGNAFNLTALVPDVSKVLIVPLKRYFFVKAKNDPTFSNGLLREIHIVKPSEAEAFASIPIRLLKAIVSIPAELFHFKITRLQQQNALEAEMQKARALQDTVAPKKGDGPLAAGDQPATPPDRQGGTKFGNLPSPPGKTGAIPEPGIRAELMARDALVGPSPLGTPLVPCVWYNSHQGNWGYYGNKTANTCTAAAAAHLIISWKAVNNPANTGLPLVSDVLKAYTGAGGTDEGLSIYNMLFYWREQVIGDDKITNFRKVKPRDMDTLKMATFWYGGSLVSFNLPDTIKDDPGATHWQVPPDSRPGTSPHSVTVLGYSDDDTIFAVSWGRIVTIDRPFYEKYNLEAWVAISASDWIGAGGKSPSNTTADLLEQQLTTFSQQLLS